MCVCVCVRWRVAVGGVISFRALGCNANEGSSKALIGHVVSVLAPYILLEMCDLCAFGNHVDLTENVVVCAWWRSKRARARACVMGGY